MFWNEKAGKWNLILAVYDRVHIYSSSDIKEWKFESEFGAGIGAHGGVWECPDLFPLTVEGSEVTKWIMLVSINPGGPNSGSATQYFTGDFDGHKFTPDNTKERWLDWGRDNYAGVTWSDIPRSDGRRIFIGWMSNWKYATVVPTIAWRSANTIPRELSLAGKKGNYYVTSKPIREFGDLRIKTDTLTVKQLSFTGEKEISTGKVNVMQSELLFGFNLSQTKGDTVGIILENSLNERVIIGYSLLHKQFYVDRKEAGPSGFSKEFAGITRAPYNAGTSLKLHLFVDASSVELFVDDGGLVITTLVFPTEKFTRVKLFSKKGDAVLTKAVFHGINKIWH
jgi:fructan beta-fructosidase